MKLFTIINQSQKRIKYVIIKLKKNVLIHNYPSKIDCGGSNNVSHIYEGADLARKKK